jgi:superoxide dismutase, Cu-Zn family
VTLRTVTMWLAIAAPLAAGAAGSSARAVLKDSQGKEVGTATLTPAEGGVAVRVQVTGLRPGKHGIHIHEVGKCKPPEFKSAGAHFNPSGKKHGLRNPEGAHAGDMPNLDVGSDGTATQTVTARGATMGEGEGSLFGPQGRALVIHADPDDERTDPSGNSGARVACGVIEKS